VILRRVFGVAGAAFVDRAELDHRVAYKTFSDILQFKKNLKINEIKKNKKMGQWRLGFSST